MSRLKEVFTNSRGADNKVNNKGVQGHTSPPQNKNNMKQNFELPKVIIDEKKLKDGTDSLFTEIVVSSQKAIEFLKGKFPKEITTDISSLDTFRDAEKLRLFLIDAQQSYTGGKYLPAEEYKRIVTMFSDLYQECLPFVHTLDNIFSKGFTLSFDGERLSASREEIEKKIRKNFIINLSETEREYYTQIGKVVEAIDELAAFENDNGLKPFAWTGTMKMSELGAMGRLLPMQLYEGFSLEKFVNALHNKYIGVQ
jgi:hypothetical protein